MIQYGIQALGEDYIVGEKVYRHLAIFVGVGAQYGVGEVVLPVDDAVDMISNVAFLERHFARYVFNGPERFWHYLHHLIPQKNAWIRAIDMASWDLHAKLQDISIENAFHQNKYSEQKNILLKNISLVQHNDELGEGNGLFFEDTQGLTDLKINTQKWSTSGALTSQGSFMTALMLSALCPERSSIFMVKDHFSKNKAYKNIELIDDQFDIHDRIPSGHGLILNR